LKTKRWTRVEETHTLRTGIADVEGNKKSLGVRIAAYARRVVENVRFIITTRTVVRMEMNVSVNRISTVQQRVSAVF
jgi:hypothetical protein